jgi:hypothetical protein
LTLKVIGNPSFMPEIPEQPKPEPALPKLSDEIGERRALREQVAAGEARIKELQRKLEGQ